MSLRLSHPLVASPLVIMVWAAAAAAQPDPPDLPPVPVPPENPITEEKRVLGKILFWEEQLSSDDTVACGTCHRPAQAGADPREATHPGRDGILGTPDDIAGSAGVVRRDLFGDAINDPVFGFDPQVTARTTPSFFTSQFAIEVFWDGRAGREFIDPETGGTIIATGGALENQALGPILNSVEMANDERTWSDVRETLEAAMPLGLATDLPGDVSSAIATNPTYPGLFAAAFGDSDITAARIGMAIATYERTLVADETAFDTRTLTPNQQQGLNAFQASPCAVCHQPPFFTDHSFRSLGVRPDAEDIGRENVTGNPNDRARFKVPSLRNVGLKPTFMHNGVRTTLPEVLAFYRDPGMQLGDDVDPLLPVLLPPPVESSVIDFLMNGLTDARVTNEEFPFDRPTLRSELPSVDIEDAPPVAAARLTLRPAFPNPVNPHTTLAYSLGERADVRLAIFDASGRLLRTLVDANQDAGSHFVRWNGRDASGHAVGAGVYYYRVTAEAETETGSVVVRR